MDSDGKIEPIPWITFEAKKWLDGYLTKDMTVFEWGSGGSTLYFAKKTKSVISVEHDKKWYDRVSAIIDKDEIRNAKYYLIKPEKNKLMEYLPYISWLYNSKTFPELKGFSFKRYVKKIDEYENNFFDLIFIDGRARSSCISKAVKKVKRGGYLMLDNSERQSYHIIMRKISKFNRMDFLGHGPYINNIWQTTIWKIS